MSITNYGELKSFLASFGHRSDLTLMIPEFVTMAQSMIAQKVRALEMVTSATLDETDRVSGGVYTLPADWLGPRQLFSTEGELKPVGLSELRRYVVSAPVFQFATYGLKVEFRGVPATDAEIELIYYGRPAAFVDAGDTNALLLSHSDLYVHACLQWLHLHTQDLELSQTHGGMFEAAVVDVNELANRQAGSGSIPAPHNLTSRSSM